MNTEKRMAENHEDFPLRTKFERNPHQKFDRSEITIAVIP
jgi:hypothetical protein